jgi:hypothetical protein
LAEESRPARRYYKINARAKAKEAENREKFLNSVRQQKKTIDKVAEKLKISEFCRETKEKEEKDL